MFDVHPTPVLQLEFREKQPHAPHTSKAALLQQKVATLPEPIAAEVLDFLEFVTAKRHLESKQQPETHQLSQATLIFYS